MAVTFSGNYLDSAKTLRNDLRKEKKDLNALLDERLCQKNARCASDIMDNRINALHR